MVKKDFNYFIGCKDTKKINLYAYFFPKWVHVEEALTKLNISSSIKDDELSGKYNEIWEKIKSSIKKELDSEPVYNEKYLKAEIKSYNAKISTNFHNNKIGRF